MRQKQHHLALTALWSLPMPISYLHHCTARRVMAPNELGSFFAPLGSVGGRKSSGLFTHFSQYGSHRGTPLIGAVQLAHTQQPHHRGRGRKPQFVFVRVGPTRVGGSVHEMDASLSMISPYQLPVTRHAIFSLAGISSPLHSAPQPPPPAPPPSIEMPTIILFRRSTLSSLLVCLHTFPFGMDRQGGR